MTGFGLRTLGELDSSHSPDPAVMDPAGSRTGQRRRGSALGALVEETVRLFRELRRTAVEIHGEGRLSGGHRNLLAELERVGPRTVPQMARARAVSRQHVQSHVNELVSQGLVEAIENPEHRRSRLVRITPDGQRRREEMNRAEAQFLGGLEIEVGTDQVEAAAEVLKALRAALRESHA